MVSLLVLGPAEKGSPRRLPPMEVKYKVVGYCDDLKPTVFKLDNFFLFPLSCLRKQVVVNSTGP